MLVFSNVAQGFDRLGVVMSVATIALGVPGCCPVFGPPPVIDCPSSVSLGETVTLTVRNADAEFGFTWRQERNGNAAGAFVINDTTEIPSSIGELGPCDATDCDATEGDVLVTHGSSVQTAVFRGDVVGTITITAEETFIGVPICVPPFPAKDIVACRIEIVE